MTSCPETGRAWLAGFMDGEGTITVTRTRRADVPSIRHRPYVSVGNTVRAPLDEIREQYGGQVFTYQAPRTMPRAKVAYRWRCPASQVVRFLGDVRPYLRLKGRQADLVLELVGGGDHRGARLPPGEFERRERLTAELRVLNRRGVE